MSRTPCPLPKLTGLVTALSILAALACMVSPAPAQQPQEKLVAAKGTHIFRRILHDLGCTPLEQASDLQRNPSEKVLILLGRCQAEQNLGINVRSFLQSGGAVLVATDQDSENDNLGPFDITVE